MGHFVFDLYSHPQTLWHRLNPRTRVLCTFLLVSGISFTPNGYWYSWGIYTIFLLFLILVSQVTLQVLIRRVMVEFLFITLVLVGSLFHSEGQVYWEWGVIKITTTGLTILGSVALKALLSLITLNLLTLTTSISQLLQALRELRMPELLVAILASMYRYIGLLVDEFATMRRAAMSRNALTNAKSYRLVVGNIIGSLFIRTYEKGERIHQAMVARGYNGIISVNTSSTMGTLDILALISTVIILVFTYFSAH